MSVSMYKTFSTDADREVAGIIVDYGTHRVTLARSGGANKEYAKVAERRSRPYRRAIENELLPNEKAQELLVEIFAEACIKQWETNRGTMEAPVWEIGIESPEGADLPLLPVTHANLVATLRALPDMFDDLQKQSMKAAGYRREVMEAEAGN